jgi:type I restriction enzyme, R subunit
MTKIYESDIEKFCIELLESQGFDYLSPKEHEIERKANLSEVVLQDRLREAVDRINPKASQDAKDEAIKQVLNLSTANLIESNEAFHVMLTEGIRVETYCDGEVRGEEIQLIDYETPLNNNLVVANQFTITHNNFNKRPDIILLVNGLPLVVIELKNPTDEQATTHKAYTQLQNYKNAIPNLFVYNSVLVASDGLDARAGSLTAGWSRFAAWKTVDGIREDSRTTPQSETLIKGMLRPDILLDLIKQFTVFEKSKKEDSKTGLITIETVKKIASYHQYHAVNRAVESTKQATSEQGSRKAGVVWHTQGSGKSLSMVFYTGKAVLALNNPTVLVITDRNDLDDQLFDTFANCKQLLRQEPVQAKDRVHIKELLNTQGGGIIFSTIQKFSPEEGKEIYDMLSDRKNIIVIADEAHRSQYGFEAKTIIKNNEAITRYGFAKYIRDALPNASFIGFTGTPIEKEDASTPAVFGNYVDVYDIEQAVIDGATVRIFYESRLAKVHLKDEEAKQIDYEVEAITEGEETTATEKAKAKWATIEAIVGHPERLKAIAEDFIKHFEARQSVFEGKAMFVAMSRRIAVDFYKAIIQLRPEWHSQDKKQGVIKVVMTSSSSDPEDWQMHHTTKQDRKDLGERLKDSNDSLKIVIVRDMWLTGFDAPCLHTLYVDKPMKGHNLMQAIARVNRVYKDKPGGLVVDYIGIASDLKKALAIYTESGGKGSPTFDQAEAVASMLEKYEVVSQMFDGFDYKKYLHADTKEKLTIILEAQEHVLGLEDGKNRFTREVGLLAQAFALSMPNLKALEINEEVGFFQAVKARLVKFDSTGGGRSDEEIETAIKQIVDRAIVSEGVIDIFDAAGIKKPDISILSDDFLEEIRGMKRKNLALELLKKILNDEIKDRSKKNLIQSKKFSEMLEKAINKYQNNLLTSSEVLDEIISMAKEFRADNDRAKQLGLSDYEIAFYDALANNDSAKSVMGNEILCELARVLVQKVKENVSIDWTIKESVRSHLRAIIKRTLNKYGYPPDQQLLATENIIKQAEMVAPNCAEEFAV